MAPRPKKPSENSFADRLIDAAERLYGKHGLEGVSLRQIGSAAGTSNNYAVQYHFDDTSGLIKAILAKRTPVIAAIRTKIQTQIEEKGQLSESRALIEIIFRPLLDYVDDQGERTYARFIFALISSPTWSVHSKELFQQLSSHHVINLLQKANSHIPPSLLRERLRLMSIMILNSVFNRFEPFDHNDFDAALIDDALNMATSAISAPIGDSMHEILKASTVASLE